MSDKTKLAWLVGLIAVAAIIWYFNGKVRSTIASNALAVAEFSYKPLGIENPELQREILKHSRETEYKTSGRDLFTGFAPPPPEPPKNEQANVQQGPIVALPPPPPALPAHSKSSPLIAIRGTGQLAPHATVRRFNSSRGTSRKLWPSPVRKVSTLSRSRRRPIRLSARSWITRSTSTSRIRRCASPGASKKRAF